MSQPCGSAAGMPVDKDRPKADNAGMEVWLRTNRRALLWGAIAPAALSVVGLCLAAGAVGGPTWARVVGWCLMVPSALSLGMLAWQARQPRLAYADGHLLVYLRSGPPIRLPLDVVECFLLGQGPSFLPGYAEEKIETANVVIRLSPKAPQWKHLEVKPALGHWCDSHVTLRGTWCEPLDVEVVGRLNARLGEVTRQ